MIGTFLSVALAACGSAGVTVDAGAGEEEPGPADSKWMCSEEAIYELPQAEEYESPEVDAGTLPPGRTVREAIGLLAEGADPITGRQPRGNKTPRSRAEQQAFARLADEFDEGRSAEPEEQAAPGDEFVVRGSVAEVRLMALPDGTYLVAGHAHAIDDGQCQEPTPAT